MIVTLTTYYAVTIETVYTAAGETKHATTVYIVETPVSWQFSPQNIRVVIGVNNTVTWVSKSISYDSATSSDGIFDSGTIQPGHTFSYTFTQPGEYDYRCTYHLWMTGSVTVLGGT